MAKKAKAKTKTTAKVVDEKGESQSVGEVRGLKQTAGAVTGAVLGGVVGGPVGALAGGALGAMVGDSSAKGKRPIGRAVDVIREEITSGRAKQRLKDVGERVGERIKSLRPGTNKEAETKKNVATAAPVKKAKKKKTAKTAKVDSKGAKSKKGAKAVAVKGKKVAKKKS